VKAVRALTALREQGSGVTLPPLRRVLHTVPLSLADWGLVLAALAPVLAIELSKLVRRLGRKRAGAALI
jgi:hypothetical protein